MDNRVITNALEGVGRQLARSIDDNTKEMKRFRESFEKANRDDNVIKVFANDSKEPVAEYPSQPEPQEPYFHKARVVGSLTIFDAICPATSSKSPMGFVVTNVDGAVTCPDCKNLL